jgi:hypothetical protein
MELLLKHEADEAERVDEGGLAGAAAKEGKVVTEKMLSWAVTEGMAETAETPAGAETEVPGEMEGEFF